MIKFKSFIYITLSVAGVLLSSCEKFLDKQEEDLLTIDQVFQNRISNQGYLANVYNYVPNFIDPKTSFTPVSDEGDFVWSDVRAQQINIGNWSPTNIPIDQFAQFYRGIRSATIYLNRGKECTECEQQIPGITTRYVAEARALRAYFYFLLLRQYGPIPIITEVLPVDAKVSDLQLPRNSFDEVVTYIVAELDKAMIDLPVQHSPADYGRMDKRTCLAIISRTLLYSASPLWNGNTDYANFKNKDGKVLVNQTYDQNKWKLAANRSKELIDLMPNGLYKKTVNGVWDPKESYQYLSIDRWNQEIIFARNFEANGWEHHMAPRQVGGWNGGGVTQEMVDAYRMSNGMQIDESGSGYVEEGFSAQAGKYTPKGIWNMWTNREPRFYASVTYNGANWIWSAQNIKIQLYGKGASGFAGSHDHTNTGYLLHRFVSPTSDVQNWNGSPQHDIHFRLGEIYLNYAEALNEVSPGNADITKYVNLIRERGGIPNLPIGLGQSEMRELIRRERRVELAFESHRVWDTRRWKIAEQTDGGPKTGMNIGEGTSFTDLSFYKRTVFETRVFQKKHYLWPIPQGEIERNKELVQNPDWN
ncbi:MAG: RagB/SusD family nutrient uptake outer membrane protein [Pelobium sp.]